MSKNDLTFWVKRTPIHLHDRDATQDVIKFIRTRLNGRFSDARIMLQGGKQKEEYGSGVVVEVSTLSPLLDLDLLDKAIEIANADKCQVHIEGAVPGTAPLRVDYYSATGRSKKIHSLLWDTQRCYNAQLNLRKSKRVKMFFYFMEVIETLACLPIHEFLNYLGTPEGVRAVLSYGTTLQLKDLDACPICGGKRLYKLHHDTGQPVIGYLTRDSEYYDLCGDCGLVFLNPTIEQDDLGNLYDWYDSEGKGDATEDLYSQAALLRHASFANFQLFLQNYAYRMPARARLLDLGGGHGEFVVTAKTAFPQWEVSMFDFKADAVSGFLTPRGVIVRSGDFIKTNLGDSEYDVISMWEVVEHLSIKTLLDIWGRVFAALKPGGHFVLSTPDFLSPYTQSQDFWAMFVPQHITVLSMPVLERLWKSAGFQLVEHDRVFSLFREAGSYFSYGALNNASRGARGDAAILDDIINNKAVLGSQKNWMLERKCGAELLLMLKKPE